MSNAAVNPALYERFMAHIDASGHVYPEGKRPQRETFNYVIEAYSKLNAIAKELSE